MHIYHRQQKKKLRLQLISEMVRKNLNIDCSVLMGANIASDIGNEQLSEATIGYAILENAQLFYKVRRGNVFVSFR